MSTDMAGDEDRAPCDTGTAPRYVPSRSQLNAYKSLQRAMSDRGGIALLYGQEGSGRRTVCRQYTNNQHPDLAVAWIDGTNVQLTSLLSELLNAFGFGDEFRTTEEMLKVIDVFATQQVRSGHVPIVIVDNVDRLLSDALQSLCELAALTDRNAFTLRFVLIGSSSPRWMRASSALNAVTRRLVESAQLEAMSLSETITFLHANLRAETGIDPERVLPRDTCSALHAQSGGRPRAVLELLTEVVRNSTSLPVRCDMFGQNRTRPQPVREWEPRDEHGPKLFVTLNGAIVQVIDLDQPKVLIGRSECCDLCLPEPIASKFHALIFRSNNRTGIVDLGSENGTFVNSERIVDQELKHLDVVSLGSHRIKFIDGKTRDLTCETEESLADTVVLAKSEAVGPRADKAKFRIA